MAKQREAEYFSQLDQDESWQRFLRTGGLSPVRGDVFSLEGCKKAADLFFEGPVNNMKR